MSMRTVSFAPTAATGDYVVVAPQAADVLSVTLRAAYATELSAYEQFSDLIQQLDRIEAMPIRG